MKTQTSFKVAGMRKEVNTEMQLLLNALKGICEPNPMLDAELAAEPEEQYAIGIRADHFLILRKSYQRVDELCNRIIEITKEEQERRIIT